MKKLYFLAAVFCIVIVNSGLAQYTAIRSGNWSSPITWDPSGIPSTVCNSCTVTVNSGVTVQLDQHVELSGNSFLYLGNGGSGVAEITIGNSSKTTITDAYNIVMDTLPGSSMIIFRTSNSIIDATAACPYDGVLAGPFPNSTYAKVIGNAPLVFQGNNIIVTSAPKYSQLSGPVTLFSGGTLPIMLKDFNAVLTNNVVNMTWATDEESNLRDFIVLRSGDGVSWEGIGTVSAKGSPSGTANYSFTDPSPLHGINYYRLQSVNNDRKYIFSEIKLIKSAFIKGITFGPNPANDHVGITFGSDISSKISVRLLNQYGQVLQQKQLTNASGTTLTLQLNNYPQGIYTLHVKGADGSQNAYRVLVAH